MYWKHSPFCTKIKTDTPHFCRVFARQFNFMYRNNSQTFCGRASIFVRLLTKASDVLWMCCGLCTTLSAVSEVQKIGVVHSCFLQSDCMHMRLRTRATISSPFAFEAGSTTNLEVEAICCSLILADCLRDCTSKHRARFNSPAATFCSQATGYPTFWRSP